MKLEEREREAKQQRGKGERGDWQEARLIFPRMTTPTNYFE